MREALTLTQHILHGDTLSSHIHPMDVFTVDVSQGLADKRKGYSSPKAMYHFILYGNSPQWVSDSLDIASLIVSI